MRRCPHRGFCLASRRTRSRISSGMGGRPVVFGWGPFSLYQAPVPGEQGAGRHDPLYPEVPGEQSRQGGYHRPVSPVWFRAGDLTAQERDLMPEYQDFHVLGTIATGEERQPAEQPDHEQIREAEEHEDRG
jgi:hypothetical protein